MKREMKFLRGVFNLSIVVVCVLLFSRISHKISILSYKANKYDEQLMKMLNDTKDIGLKANNAYTLTPTTNMTMTMTKTGLTEEFKEVARVMASEACGEGERGLRAVASVIYYRSLERKQSPYEVVTAPKQFTGYVAKNKKKLYYSVKKLADAIALEMQREVFTPLFRANHYLNVDLCKKLYGRTPLWYRKNKNKVVAKVGKHTFLHM